MNNFAFENHRFVYTNTNGKKVLLDCRDYLYNKSRVPFHSLDGTLTIPDILSNLLEEYSEVYRGTEEYIMGFYYTLLGVLVTAEHIKTSAPKKVMEIGCGTGILSYHLATLLGKLHPQSLLYSISNTIGNESDNQWLDYISQVEELPKIAFAAVDYEELHLRDEHFDITIINVCEQMEQTKQMVEEAIRVTKTGGKIICLAKFQPLLESIFQLLLPENEEYFLNEEIKILVAEKLKKIT